MSKRQDTRPLIIRGVFSILMIASALVIFAYNIRAVLLSNRVDYMTAISAVFIIFCMFMAGIIGAPVIKQIEINTKRMEAEAKRPRVSFKEK